MIVQWTILKCTCNFSYYRCRNDYVSDDVRQALCSLCDICIFVFSQRIMFIYERFHWQSIVFIRIHVDVDVFVCIFCIFTYHSITTWTCETLEYSLHCTPMKIMLTWKRMENGRQFISFHVLHKMLWIDWKFNFACGFMWRTLSLR